MKRLWVWHPNKEGVPVMVSRGFWARLVRSKHVATQDEAMAYDIFKAGFRARRTPLRQRFNEESG